MIALYVSQSVSQFFYDLIPYQSDTTFWVLGLLILISCIPPLFLKNPKIIIPNLSLFSILKTTSFSWLGLNASLISGAILTAIYSFLPLLAKKLGLSISLAMSFMILGGLLCQWPVGALSDRMDRKKLLLWIGCLTLIPYAIPFFFEISKIGYYVIIVSIGILSFALYPVGMTLVCENKPSEELTGLTELLLLFYSVGMIFGPLLTPLFNKITDPFGLYLEIIAFSSIITAHCVFGLLKKRLPSTSP
jgi:MFS family permease